MEEVTIDQAMTVALEHYRADRAAEAEQICRLILASQPDHDGALNLFGILAYQAGRNDLARNFVLRAISIHPKIAEYHSNLGNLLQADGQVLAAIEAYQKAIAIEPGLAAVHNNLGSALTAAGQLDAAIASHQIAIELDPQNIEAYNNLGNALVDQGEVDRAIIAYRQAIAIKMDHAEVHANLGMCLLLKGEYIEGWQEYEWRRKSKVGRPFSQPMWHGENFADQTILLTAEQGFGDTVQFIRYVELVKSRGGKVIVQCHSDLIPLLQQLPSVDSWTASGESLPAFDVWCPLMSLPGIFGTTVDTIPKQNPLLKATDKCAANDLKTLRIGLVWAGQPKHKNDCNRSISLSLLAPLLAMTTVQFVSLQTGSAALQADGFSDALIRPTLTHFADTAAIISQLDLVISVDTSVAHLAGAMGKPVWLMLPFAADWRWLLERSDSPWYPTMRLYRQKTIGDWSGVVGRVFCDLLQLSKDSR